MKKGSEKHQCEYCGKELYLHPGNYSGLFARCHGCGAEYKSNGKGQQIFTLQMGNVKK